MPCFLNFSLETSSIAKAWTGAFDDLIHNVMAKHLGEHTPMDSPGLAEYPDFFAAALIMLLAGDICNFDMKYYLYHRWKNILKGKVHLFIFPSVFRGACIWSEGVCNCEYCFYSSKCDCVDFYHHFWLYKRRSQKLAHQ